MSVTSQVRVQWCHTGSLKTATVRVFTPWKQARAINQGSPLPFLESWLMNIYQHITVYSKFIQFAVVVVELLSHVWPFCHPMDCSPPGSSVHGAFQAIILEWIAIFFSRESSWPRNGTLVDSLPLSHQGSPLM